jgi:hypothetical protein
VTFFCRLSWVDVLLWNFRHNLFSGRRNAFCRKQEYDTTKPEQGVDKDATQKTSADISRSSDCSKAIG